MILDYHLFYDLYLENIVVVLTKNISVLGENHFGEPWL